MRVNKLDTNKKQKIKKDISYFFQLLSAMFFSLVLLMTLVLLIFPGFRPQFYYFGDPQITNNWSTARIPDNPLQPGTLEICCEDFPDFLLIVNNVTQNYTYMLFINYLNTSKANIYLIQPNHPEDSFILSLTTSSFHVEMYLFLIPNQSGSVMEINYYEYINWVLIDKLYMVWLE
jgi:hypothetical protein